MSDLRINIKTGKGILTVCPEGLYFGSMRVFSLSEAETYFDNCLRAIRTVLEAEGTPARASAPGEGGEESGVSDPFAQASAPFPANPSGLEESARNASVPYCPFCYQPTCECWRQHVCR